ncbi:MAG: hypothetical protein M1834_009481 [Cirrosporium novae-zelandiae]|nr:MAG: hypothetical protein M1834_009481 [Cirrosporium novae-zelandiae]
MSDPSTISPLAFSPSQESALLSNPGFKLLRSRFSTIRPSFCSDHLPTSDAATEAWLLHRDITFTLILPILRIYDQAAQVARSLLRTLKATDLELAFFGEGRGAFSWLQCFVKDEEDWFSVKGCPACTTLHILHSEPTVRLTLTSIYLSAYLSFPLPPSASSSPARASPAKHSHHHPEQQPTLPSFQFLMPSLHHALMSDPLIFPASSIPQIYSRSHALETGIQDLLLQCCALSSIEPSLESTITTHENRLVKRQVSYRDASDLSYGQSGVGMKVKPSKLAKRQMRLCLEEREWARRIALALEEWRDANEKGISENHQGRMDEHVADIGRRRKSKST